jgi:hypothetical protein
VVASWDYHRGAKIRDSVRRNPGRFTRAVHYLGFDGIEGIRVNRGNRIDVRVVRATSGRQSRGWATDPRERMEGRTGFFLLFILFSSRD